MAGMKINDVVRHNVAGCGRTQDYRLGCEQLARWKNRHLLPKCKCCGRQIDGEMKRGFCIWCASMDPHAQCEIKRIEKAKGAENYARRIAREAAQKGKVA